MGFRVRSGVYKEVRRPLSTSPTSPPNRFQRQPQCTIHSIIAIMDHNRGSNGPHHRLAEDGTENPPSAGFPSFESLGYSMEQAPWSTEVVPTLSLQAADEGLGSSPCRR